MIKVNERTFSVTEYDLVIKGHVFPIKDIHIIKKDYSGVCVSLGKKIPGRVSHNFNLSEAEERTLREIIKEHDNICFFDLLGLGEEGKSPGEWMISGLKDIFFGFWKKKNG
jgi:hypothetical protein